MQLEDYNQKLKSLGFERIYTPTKFPDRTLYLTGCGKSKSNLAEGISEDIYKGAQQVRFYKYFRESGLSYGTLSDKYGIVFPKEKIKNYDFSPKDLTESGDLERMQILISSQIPKNTENIVFVSNRFLQSFAFFRLFKNVQLKKYYVTKIENIKNLNPLKKSLF